MAETPMPVFTIKARDALAVPALRAYKRECEEHGLVWQADQVEQAILEVLAWQLANMAATKLPDHGHIPAGTSPRPWTNVGGGHVG